VSKLRISSTQPPASRRRFFACIVLGMQRAAIIFLALALAALVGVDLIKAIGRGRVRTLWGGSFSHRGQPGRFRRYVAANCIVLAFCTALIVWAALILP
jgi:hypothetical protein